MSDDHDRSSTRTNRLLIVLAINIALIVVLGIVGLSSHSLGVLAAAAEYIADAAAILLILVAHVLEKRGFGAAKRARPTEWVALLNAALVVVISLGVIFEAVKRLGHPENVHGFATMVVSIVAMAVMAGCALLLMGDDDLGVRSVLLDTAGDAAAAGAVAVAGAVIWLTSGRFLRLDPILALLVSCVVIYHATGLVRETIAALRA